MKSKTQGTASLFGWRKEKCFPPKRGAIEATRREEYGVTRQGGEKERRQVDPPQAILY